MNTSEQKLNFDGFAFKCFIQTELSQRRIYKLTHHELQRDK